ncbi:SHOCT domain-containing protein [Natronorubrum texcoconense]|uniref:Short C-terminal domain-containing protein n=1 Tax=Natronorubrum texcoconense TaxID=1095776 RepID=A0A1G9CXD2_9EURY|nr:SHOCT domain-containing protein [Natronorubrum texcoconense]SDK56331.1 Short C-terminal domain-containing protein [Natronorubrum texcoconense]
MPFDEQPSRQGDARAIDDEGVDGLEIGEPDRRQLRERLDDDERVQYALRGRIMDYETNDDDRDRREESRTRKMASRGRDLLTLVTDRRLLIVIQREAPADHEYRSIPYDELGEATLETANGNQRLVLRGPKRYYIDVGRSATDDATAACSTIRQQLAAESDDDSFDSLERLEALFERGHLTEREFETMKRELLE